MLLTIKQSIQGDTSSNLFAEPLREDAPKAPMWFVPIDFERVKQRFEIKRQRSNKSLPGQTTATPSLAATLEARRAGKRRTKAPGAKPLDVSTSVGVLQEVDSAFHGTDTPTQILAGIEAADNGSSSGGGGDGGCGVRGRSESDTALADSGRGSTEDTTIAPVHGSKVMDKDKPASEPTLGGLEDGAGNAMDRWVQARSCLKLAAVSYFHKPPRIRPKYVLVICGKNRLHGHFAEKVKNGLVDAGVAVRVALSGQDTSHVLSAVADADLVLIVVADGDDEIFLGRMVQETSELDKPVLMCPYTVSTPHGASGGLQYSAATINIEKFRTVCFTDWLGKGFEEQDLVYQQLSKRLRDEVVQFVLPAEEQNLFAEEGSSPDIDEWGSSTAGFGPSVEFADAPLFFRPNNPDRLSLIDAELQSSSQTDGTKRAAASSAAAGGGGRDKPSPRGKSRIKKIKKKKQAAGAAPDSARAISLLVGNGSTGGSTGGSRGNPDAPQWSMLAGGPPPPPTFAPAASKFDKQRRVMAMRPQKWTKQHTLTPITATTHPHQDDVASQQAMRITNSKSPSLRKNPPGTNSKRLQPVKQATTKQAGNQPNRQGSLKARMSHLKEARA